ncbi:MAG: hypothetical protein HY552_02360 [Elusimicrobia bacterium]|nr:hypothetical protein [Elusimicrobiota bacterium]
MTAPPTPIPAVRAARLLLAALVALLPASAAAQGNSAVKAIPESAARAPLFDFLPIQEAAPPDLTLGAWPASARDAFTTISVPPLPRSAAAPPRTTAPAAYAARAAAGGTPRDRAFARSGDRSSRRPLRMPNALPLSRHAVVPISKSVTADEQIRPQELKDLVRNARSVFGEAPPHKTADDVELPAAASLAAPMIGVSPDPDPVGFRAALITRLRADKRTKLHLSDVLPLAKAYGVQYPRALMRDMAEHRLIKYDPRNGKASYQAPPQPAALPAPPSRGGVPAAEAAPPGALQDREEAREAVRGALDAVRLLTAAEIQSKVGLDEANVVQALESLQGDGIARAARRKTATKWHLVPPLKLYVRDKIQAFALWLTGGKYREDSLAHMIVEGQTLQLNRRTCMRIIKDLLALKLIERKGDGDRYFIGSRSWADPRDMNAYAGLLRNAFGNADFTGEEALDLDHPDLDPNQRLEAFIALQAAGAITEERGEAGEKRYKIRRALARPPAPPPVPPSPPRPLLERWQGQPDDAQWDVYLSAEVDGVLKKLSTEDAAAYRETIEGLRALARHGATIKNNTLEGTAKDLRHGMVWELRPYGHRLFFFFASDMKWVVVWNYVAKGSYDEQTRAIDRALEFRLGPSYRKWENGEKARRGVVSGPASAARGGRGTSGRPAKVMAGRLGR